MYGYTGEPVDSNELVYLRNRYYNPNLGTFVSQDPYEGVINNPMSLNRYSYVQGNPVNLTDPSGMISVQAMNCLMQSNPLALAQALSSGLCFVQIGTETPTPTPFPTSRPPEMCPSNVTPIPTPISTPTLPPLFPTNTPRVTPTPTPQLRLPLGDAMTSDAILTPYGCSWINSNGSPLRSRDVNPRCMTSTGGFIAQGGIPANVYAPVPQAEVMIVDQDAGALGKFVAIRIDSQYLPQLGLGNGHLYIGYSHLSQILVSSGTGRPDYPTVAMSPIGVTGQTGTDNIHLDVMAFFIPDVGTAITTDPAPWRTVAGTETDLHLNSQAFFRLGGVGNFAEVFNSQEIDPLTIWPALGDSQVCG
jgi:RHS repeat-associated protein